MGCQNRIHAHLSKSFLNIPSGSSRFCRPYDCSGRSATALPGDGIREVQHNHHNNCNHETRSQCLCRTKDGIREVQHDDHNKCNRETTTQCLCGTKDGIREVQHNHHNNCSDRWSLQLFYGTRGGVRRVQHNDMNNWGGKWRIQSFILYILRLWGPTSCIPLHTMFRGDKS